MDLSPGAYVFKGGEHVRQDTYHRTTHYGFTSELIVFENATAIYTTEDVADVRYDEYGGLDDKQSEQKSYAGFVKQEDNILTFTPRVRDWV